MPENTDIKIIDGLPIPTRKTRKQIVVATLLFCWSIIIFSLVWGNPENMMHVSAQSWAFGLSGATIFSYVFGAVIDNYNVMRNASGDFFFRNKSINEKAN